MALEFTETLTLELPDMREQLSVFGEADGDEHGLIVEVAAIHEGLTSNYNSYSKAALEEALESWVSPYPKPIIMNHDPTSEPVGRVMAAKMDSEADGTPFIRLQIAVTDTAAMKKVSDKRYLTGSVGGKAKEANCSVCGTDWSEASAFNMPCKHVRGKTYKGKLAFINMHQIQFKEYSFVNMPADQLSGVRAVGAPTVADSEESDGWVRAAKVYALNMDKEEILECTESEIRNVLEGMKRKEASPLYLGLKGAFLSALAAQESLSDKELSVEEATERDEDDVLAVAEELSTDLAEEPQEAEEDPKGEEEKPKDEEEPKEEPSEDGETAEPETVADDEDEEKKEEEDPEEAAPEGQEKGGPKDTDPEKGRPAPRNREGDEGPEDDEDDEEQAKAEEEPKDESAESELKDAIKALERRLEELETQNTVIAEENVKLRSVLKQSLAERVVDTKIALGLVRREDRETELTEHAERTARSLADSLRDLAAMAPSQKDYTDIPKVGNQGVIANPKEDSTVTLDAEEVVNRDPESVLEGILVDTLMGRRKL